MIYSAYKLNKQGDSKQWMGKTRDLFKKIRDTNNLRYTDDTTPMAENEKELKNLLLRVKKESEKAGLKLNIQKIKIMDPVPSIHGK